MTTPQEVQTTEVFFDRGILMDLYIGKPTFQRKLRPNDVLLEGSIDEDAIYLGHKKLLPKSAMETLVTLEGQARTALANRSLEFPISGARFVYYGAMSELRRRLVQIQEQWNAAVASLIQEYPALREQQLTVLDKQCEDLMHKELSMLSATERHNRALELGDWLDRQRATNRSLYPPVDQLPRMFNFSWRVFKASAPTGLEEMSTLSQEELVEASEALKRDLQQWVQRATTDMHLALGQAASQAKQLFEKNGKIQPRNLRPLFEAFETFNAIDFTGSSDWRQQIESARERFIKRDTEGNVDFDLTAASINGTHFASNEFKALLEAVGGLAVAKVAEEAGRAAISRVGEFKRFVEV